MDTAIQLLVISLCACAARSEPPPPPRHAAQFAHDLEPYAFAAIPLHSPMPVLHILSPMPLTAPVKRHKHPPARRPAYSRPQNNDYFAANSEYGIVYEPSAPERAQYGHSRPQRQPDPWESEEAPTILYARPSSHGGYVYRRPAGAAPHMKTKQPDSPVILRIHKYKVIKDHR